MGLFDSIKSTFKQAKEIQQEAKRIEAERENKKKSRSKKSLEFLDNIEKD